MMKHFAIPILASLLSVSAAAQETPWTLEACILHALEHNLTIKQQQLQVTQSEIELNTSESNKLPDISAGTYESLNFGQGRSVDNTYTRNSNSTSTSFSLSSSVPIFQGTRINNTIKQNRLNLEAATQDLEKARDNIRVAVAQAYVQILYNMEILDVALNQIKIDSLQVERLTVMEQIEKASSAEVAQQKAALGQSRLSATQARNNLNLSLLDLSQLLELHDPEGFSIVRPEVDIDNLLLGSPDDIYADAVRCKPIVKAEEFRLDAQDYSVKIAKGGYLPTLSASAGLGSSYFTSSKASRTYTDPASGQTHVAPLESFSDQLKNNFNQSIGLSLSIPIFSRFQTRNQIRSAELSRTNQQLQLENVKKNLYKEIQQAYYNALAAQQRYRASRDARASAKESYDLVTAKYENGKANITEFNESRNAFLESESNVAQARYECLFSARLLDFYRGDTLHL
ncbi:MAG: TolC family protein [Bacteroidales bacterium]|jgi:outer membrane protein|nr:TolC family protein [Bacteroidales bacterium]